ncbi:hypothetical protein PENTCL1PPCAC_18095, partial [Pristionchus entomophagus]
QMRLYGTRRSRLFVCGIFIACLIAVNVMLSKIRRVIHLGELEKSSRLHATLTSAVYYPSTVSGKDHPLIYFLLHSDLAVLPADLACRSANGTTTIHSSMSVSHGQDSGLMFGWCESVEGLVDFTVKMDTFTATIDPVYSMRTYDSVTCASNAFLYEDQEAIRSLLSDRNSTGDRSHLLVLYVSSIQAEIFASLQEEFQKDIKIIPWGVGTREGPFIHLRKTAYERAVAASFADCWLRYAPFSSSITLLDLNSVPFDSSEVLPRLSGDRSLLHRMGSSWEIEHLKVQRIEDSSGNGVELSESCYCRRGCATHGRNSSREIKCARLAVKHNPAIWRSRTLKFHRKSTDIPPYSTVLQQCLYRNPFTRGRGLNDGEVLRKRLLFNVEKEVDETSEDPCEIGLKKDDLQCITAVEVDQPLYHEDLRLAVVQRRSLKKHWDGCYA